MVGLTGSQWKIQAFWVGAGNKEEPRGPEWRVV